MLELTTIVKAMCIHIDESYSKQLLLNAKNNKHDIPRYVGVHYIIDTCFQLINQSMCIDNSFRM